MNRTNKSLRLKANLNQDQYINVNLQQDFDILEVLTLKLNQEDVYKTHTADYGCVVGRVLANGGVGVPNARISLFIPLEDNEKPLIKALYPYKTVIDKNSNGVRYNLLPDESESSCHVAVGTFPSKRKLLDNDILLEIHSKYYKFTTVTNESGDYMLFGVPTGYQTIHCDVDYSNIGTLSVKPYDLITQGYNKNLFDSPTKFKYSTDLDSLTQIYSVNIGKEILPFWGEEQTENNNISIARCDISLPLAIKSYSFFIGSTFQDLEKNSINGNGRPKKTTGLLGECKTTAGTITFLRKKSDGTTEEFLVNNGRNIDDSGVFCFQVENNLSYYITDEFGNLIPSEKEGVGIATEAKVRIKIELDQTSIENCTAKYLIPNYSETPDYTFSDATPSDYFVTFKRNQIYSIKSFIPRYQLKYITLGENKHTGLKDIDGASNVNHFPFNQVDADNNFLFTVLCLLVTLIVDIVTVINRVIKLLRKVRIKVPYINLKCNNESYQIGSGSATSDFMRCFSTNLAINYKLFDFLFYNDFVNGTLYFPATNVSYDSNGKKIDFSKNNSTTRYDGKVISPDYNASLKTSLSKVVHSGLFYYDDIKDELFYSASLSNFDTGSKFPFLRTGIINLGAISNCASSPILYDSLPNSTYFTGPLIAEYDDNDNISGNIQNGLITYDIEGLLLNIDCKGVHKTSFMPINIKRLSELSLNRVNETALLDNDDIANKAPRKIFEYLNIPSYKLDINNLTGDFSDPNYNFLYDYMQYEGLTFSSDNGTSLYFYFGLNAGHTAIEELKRNYLVKCNITTKPSYFLTLKNLYNSSTQLYDILNIKVTGGSSPYDFNIYDKYDNFISGYTAFAPTSTNPTLSISGFTAGSYTVKCYDKNDNLAIKSIYINGYQGVDFNYNAISSTKYDIADGSLILSKTIGGKSPYTYTLTLGNTTIDSFTGTTHITSNLLSGNYTLTVVDGYSNTKSKSITIGSLIGQLTASQTITPQYCAGNTSTGILKLTITGGVRPYKITVPSTNYVDTPLTTLYLGSSITPYTYTIKDSYSTQQTFSGNATIPSQFFTGSTSVLSSLVTFYFDGGDTTTIGRNVEIVISDDYENDYHSVARFNNYAFPLPLPSGNYTYTCTDYSGCVMTGEFTTS